jgi:hypothetical protein
MKLTRAANYLLMFSLFLSGAVRAASLMHDSADARAAFGNLRAMRAANAKTCLREWRYQTARDAA